jgi:hypothetical protein
LPELPGEIEVTSTIRRLARELVIFVFIAGFIGSAVGSVHEFEQTKPVPATMPVDVPRGVPPGATLVPIKPPPPGFVIDPLPICKTVEDDWQVRDPTAPLCQETQEQIDSRLAREKARFEAGEKAKRESRLLDVSAFGVFGFGIGGLAGALLWVFYRGARFAIYG